ncbi:MAG TPA: glutamate--tRNA ligase [Candidatus Saccharimonadales bacterium]|nr:glutamate--tRNA ligase [Candidatus Saccharimonadales bacterium]
MTEVRTRFAPSPTGYLHVGGIRTALFGWLLARQDDGQFILRLEDTDRQREVKEAKDHIINSLDALGLKYDEGPNKGGPYAPYIQSERLDIYHNWANKLISSGRAYADPYSTEEVQAFREEAAKNKRPFLYRNHRPDNPSPWDGSTPLRFKSEPKAYAWHDAVMGELNSSEEAIDDFILVKSDGFPTYNFAHIVDDCEMKITHILRGQEFLPSVPNYLNLYEALGLTPPILATLPHVLGPDGKKKLSKRDGARDILDYIKLGYLPEALISFIATLGWNDGSEQEIFTRDELIKKFSLDRVGRAGAQFDERRLNWINGNLIRQMDLNELYNVASQYWPTEADGFSDSYKMEVLGLIQERLKFLAEIPELSRFFFVDLPLDPTLISEHKQLSKLSNAELKEILIRVKSSLEQSDYTIDDITNRLNSLLTDTGLKPVVLFSLIRIATTQAPASPSLAGSLSVLGKDKVNARLTDQINNL